MQTRRDFLLSSAAVIAAPKPAAARRNVAGGHRDIVERARRIMSNARTESALFPLKG